MARDDPFDELERIVDLMGGQLAGETTEAVPVDVADEGDRYVVTADLPGYERDGIDVKLTDERTLHVSAVPTGTEWGDEAETDRDVVEYLAREREQGSVSRTLTLPDPVVEDETLARFERGVLRVTLPKRAAEGESGTSIPVE